MNQNKSISVIIPVSERGDNLLNVFDAYYENIEKTGIEVEYIIVLTPQYAHLEEPLSKRNAKANLIKIIVLNRNYGEAGELNIGLDHAKYDLILTLPAYEQVAPEAMSEIIVGLDDNDAIVVNRWPRLDPLPNKIQSQIFHRILKLLSYDAPKDAGCGIRLAYKEVFKDIKLYGDLHRFFFILAKQAGFKVNEIDIPQSRPDAHRRIYTPRTYFSRLLDILTIGFLTRFNKKPLRFFGTGGAISVIIGIIGLTYITIERLLFNVAVGDRPLLVLFSLFLVLGAQLIAIGLVGETIIFTSSKNNKEYRIKKVIN